MKAYPTPTRVDKEAFDTGMELRDYFASQVFSYFLDRFGFASAAKHAYRAADEMIKAREAE